MERLGEALRRAAPRLMVLGDDTDPEYIERFLLDLPPTDQLRADYEAAISAALFEDLPPMAAVRAHDRADRLARQIKLAERRDGLQALRSDGCWCLGVGGRGRVPLATGRREPVNGDGRREIIVGAEALGVDGFREYCACSDGQAARLRDAAAVRDALLERQRTRIVRMWGDLPREMQGWSLETLARLSAPHARFADLLRRWCDTDRWLYLYGPVGTGKSGGAIGALRELVERGQSGLFRTVPALLTRIRQTYSGREDAQGDEAGVLASLYSVDVLVLDDAGMESAATDWAPGILFQVVNARYLDQKRTIFTSNLTLDEWAAHLRSLAVSSRISHMATAIDCAPLPYLRTQEELAL